MRFVPTFCLREGMRLGDNLYGNKGELMLSKGVVLNRHHISVISRLNFNGLYVDDDLSRDIEIVHVINEKVRAQTVKSVKNIFIHTEKSSSKAKHDYLSIQKQIESIVDELLGSKNLMINMVDMKVFDDYTYYHSVNVAVLSIVMGVALGFKKKYLCDLGLGALLHDIGKVFIRKEILNKPGLLTDEEFAEMKMHPEKGCKYIKKEFAMPVSSYHCILDHHEKFGGGGYPYNLSGEAISLYGRIISVADVYDALTSDRPYRRAMSPSEAMEYIMGSTESMFDPKLVSVFIRKIAPYPIGTLVELSNGLSGIVIENYEEFCMRPKVRIYKDRNGEIEPFELSLADPGALNITVMKVLRDH